MAAIVSETTSPSSLLSEAGNGSEMAELTVQLKLPSVLDVPSPAVIVGVYDT